MTTKCITDMQVKKKLPSLIDAGYSPHGAATAVGIGLKRLRRLATPKQTEALLANKEILSHKGRKPLPRKEGLETQEGLRAAVDDAIQRGLGINATFLELEITHYMLMKNITPEQEQALRANRQARQRPKDVFDEEDIDVTTQQLKREVIKKPCARNVMRDIIATHPQLARAF